LNVACLDGHIARVPSFAAELVGVTTYYGIITKHPGENPSRTQAVGRLDTRGGFGIISVGILYVQVVIALEQGIILFPEYQFELDEAGRHYLLRLP
jgi:hypothetical protein